MDSIYLKLKKYLLWLHLQNSFWKLNLIVSFNLQILYKLQEYLGEVASSFWFKNTLFLLLETILVMLFKTQAHKCNCLIVFFVMLAEWVG